MKRIISLSTLVSLVAVLVLLAIGCSDLMGPTSDTMEISTPCLAKPAAKSTDEASSDTKKPSKKDPVYEYEVAEEDTSRYALARSR